MEKFVSSYICMYIYIYICVCVCVCVCVYIYIYIYIYGSVRQILLTQIYSKFRTELKQIFRSFYIYRPSGGVTVVHSVSMACCSAH